jgi:hypothetical protein
MSNIRKSPFVYGQVVDKQHFTNREKELDQLKRNLLQGIHTTIIAPRRWGKTSLVKRALLEIGSSAKDIITVELDLFSVGSEKEFLELFSRKVIAATTSGWEEQIKLAKDVFKQLVPKITIGTEPLSEFSLSFEWNELKKHTDEILNLPEAIATKKNKRVLVCIDEFQNISSFEQFEVFEKKLRAAWQHHKKVSYCLYGSRRHMMEEIFNDSSKPFFRFGDIMSLGKIQEERWVMFISEGFASTGKNISFEDAASIARLMKNHSWYVQQLAHYVWNLTEDKADEQIIVKALNEVVSANTPLFQKQTEIISSTQFNLLKALLNGETQLTGVDAMQRFALGTPNNILKNKKRMIEEDILIETDHGLEFSDPVYEIWLRRLLEIYPS